MSVKILVLRAPGTNCDEETARAVRDVGLEAEVVHVSLLIRGRKRLEDYAGLIIPGGFSYGDRVRAGAILGKLLEAHLGDELRDYVSSGAPVLGICNGFQALVEAGLLPDSGRFGGVSMALAPNVTARFEARWVRLIVERPELCAFTRLVPEGALLRMPVAHAEGRFIAPPEALRDLVSRPRTLLRYAKPDGSPAAGEYPYNPNGSMMDLAGLCNERGNVMGLMPHPERALYSWQLPEGPRNDSRSDGRLIFASMADYVLERLR
ncbi:MAG: phosphoribosylformylglycinamidine synthase I [Fervidicoccaceae archaeon]